MFSYYLIFGVLLNYYIMHATCLLYHLISIFPFECVVSLWCRWWWWFLKSNKSTVINITYKTTIMISVWDYQMDLSFFPVLLYGFLFKQNTYAFEIFPFGTFRIMDTNSLISFGIFLLFSWRLL